MKLLLLSTHTLPNAAANCCGGGDGGGSVWGGRQGTGRSKEYD